MSESITNELRDCIFDCPHLKGIADRIDARFTHELQAKQEEIDGLRSDNADLQARLDASIPLPVDADGASEPRKVCQVIPPLRVDFETGELELQFPEYEYGDHDIDRVSVFLKDIRCFEPYSEGQQFRVTIEAMTDEVGRDENHE